MAKWHHWNEREDDVLRLEYKQTHRSAMEIAVSLNIPWGQVRARCSYLGICKRTGRIAKRYWTREDDARLKELIHTHALATIGNIMGRSTFSIKVRATRLKLGLRSRDGWYTKKEVCEILGVDRKRVQSYIDARQLKASYHNRSKPGKEGMAMWHIDEADLSMFIRKYCHEFNGRNIDLVQIVDLMVGIDKAPRGKKNE